MLLRNYERDIKNTQALTEELGLNFDLGVLKGGSTPEFLSVVDWLSKYILMTKRDVGTLYNNCISEHLGLKLKLEHILGMKTLITIGDIHIDGVPLYSPTKESLQAELDDPITSPEQARDFNGHVWLTTSTFGILDMVLPAKLMAKYGQADHFADELVLYVEDEVYPTSVRVKNPNKGILKYKSPNDRFFKIRFEPMIVGAEYLLKSDPAMTLTPGLPPGW
jgi:hypothetical protein